MENKEDRFADVADHTRTHNALRELCRQRGTSLEEQSPCGEDIVLWADALMRELESDLYHLIAWVGAREDELHKEGKTKSGHLVEIIHRRLRHQDLKATDRTRSFREIAVELWTLLDHIDTLDDACREDDARFRKRAYEFQQRRHALLRSDGYRLFDLETGEQVDGEPTRGRRYHELTARIPSATLDEIAAEHRREVDKLLSGHYTATKKNSDCIAALTEDALAKAAAVWETRLAEQETAGRILAFLDAIETTEIVTANGGDRDVDPDGHGFSGEMLKLIEAIAADENDVWNTAARCALAGRTTQDLRAVHWREAFDLAIGCIDFAATSKNDGPEFLDALRKYADLMIQELEPASDEEKADGEAGTTAEGRQPESQSEGRRDS